MLTELDRDYVARRRRTLRHLPLVTWLLPLVWVVGVAVATRGFPPIVDVMGVEDRLGEGVVNWELTRTLARMAPILFVIMLAFVTAVLVGWLRMLYRERRLLDVVERLEQEIELRTRLAGGAPQASDPL